jgi:hypothetical protein
MFVAALQVPPRPSLSSKSAKIQFLVLVSCTFLNFSLDRSTQEAAQMDSKLFPSPSSNFSLKIYKNFFKNSSSSLLFSSLLFSIHFFFDRSTQEAAEIDSKLLFFSFKICNQKKKEKKEAFELGHVENAQISHELKQREN